MKPFFASSASRRSLIAISVGHFMSTPPSSVGKVCAGRPSTAPPDSTPRMREHQPYILNERLMLTRHRVGGVRPGVAAVVGRAGVFLEVELLDRVGLGAVRQARQEARHRQAEVARVLRLAQRAPGGVFRRREDLGQIARVGQLLPASPSASRVGRGAGDERRVRRRGDLAPSRPAARRRAGVWSK